MAKQSPEGKHTSWTLQFAQRVWFLHALEELGYLWSSYQPTFGPALVQDSIWDNYQHSQVIEAR